MHGWGKRLSFISSPPRTRRYLAQSTKSMAQIAKINIPATGRTIELPTGLFINNEFVPSVDSQDTLGCAISE